MGPIYVSITQLQLWIRDDKTESNIRINKTPSK